ncbi:hypothetical protein MUP77_09005 [Candidatus Bathyarchaeota archaeon]|nr:hypothetical protein [Candidatus Bathyarchaeota archaeon]
MSKDIVLFYAKNCEEKGRYEIARLLRELVAKNPNPPYSCVYHIIKDVLFVETPMRDLRPDIRDYVRKLKYVTKSWERGKEVSEDTDMTLSKADMMRVAQDWMLLGQESVRIYASRLENLANNPKPVYRDSWSKLLSEMLSQREKETKRITFERIQT